MDTTTATTMIEMTKTKAGLIGAGIFGAGVAVTLGVNWMRGRKAEAKNTDEKKTEDKVEEKAA